MSCYPARIRLHGSAGASDRLARRLIDVLRLVDGDSAIDVYDDARLSISRIHGVLLQRFPGGIAGHPATRSMVDAVATHMGPRSCPKDEARIAIAPRDQDRMPSLRIVVAGRERTGGAFAMDVDPAELGVVFALDEVVADFVNQR